MTVTRTCEEATKVTKQQITMKSTKNTRTIMDRSIVETNENGSSVINRSNINDLACNKSSVERVVPRDLMNESTTSVANASCLELMTTKNDQDFDSLSACSSSEESGSCSVTSAMIEATSALNLSYDNKFQCIFLDASSTSSAESEGIGESGVEAPRALSMSGSECRRSTPDPDEAALPILDPARSPNSASLNDQLEQCTARRKTRITAISNGCNNINVEDSTTAIDIGTNAMELNNEYDDRVKRSLFHEAVRSGDAKRVASLIADGAVDDLDEPDWNVSGDPPLLVAATHHHFSLLCTLLSNGCNPGVRSPRGETALHRAILNGSPGNSSLKFIKELLKYGCSPGVKESGGGLTALHVFTRQLCHAQSSKMILRNDDYLEQALETLTILANAGSINEKDHQGRSALHILASSTIFNNNTTREIECLIKALLDAGADPSLNNDRGETALHECLECGALNIACLLMPHTPIGISSRYGETPLHVAARKNYTDVMRKLLESGEDPSVQDAGGNTPLHLASARGFHRALSLLLTCPSIDLEKPNDEGLTALQVAAESGFIHAVRLLLKAGADPTHTVSYCTTLRQRHPDIFTLINHEVTRRRQLPT